MPFCHIYARKDGYYRVRMHGTISQPEGSPPTGGTVEYVSRLFATEQDARRWVRDGRQRDGLEDMPEPRVIRRGGERSDA